MKPTYPTTSHNERLFLNNLEVGVLRDRFENLPVTCYWVARRYSRIYRKFKLTTSWCLETCHSDPLGITWPCCCTAVLPLMEPGTTSSGIDALGLRLIVLDDEVHTAMPSLFTHVCMSLYTSFCIRGCSNIQSHQM